MTTLSADKPKTNLRNINVFEHIKFEHLAAGVSGGVIANLVLHPLDILKIRFAVNDGRAHSAPKYNGIIDAFSTIYKNEGFRGLYRGVTPNVAGAGAAWGFYFLFYNGIKNFLQKGNHDVHLGPATHLLAASEAGFVTLLITNPLWVVKTRLCLQYSLGGKNVQLYDGMIDCLVKIYKQDGFLGYYKGLAPGIFGVSHGAVQFMVYEELKNGYSYYTERPVSAKLGTLEYLTFSASSKLVAVCTTYPYQVIRARLQNQHYSYNGSIHCIQQTLQFEGWRGFYKGMGTNLIRVTPATMITFLVYENVSHLLLKWGQPKPGMVINLPTKNQVFKPFPTKIVTFNSTK